jgi:two-component system sensor histidine kinase DegS
MIQTIKSTISDMRNIIYNLRPMSIDDLGLVATIDKYIDEVNQNNEVDISLIVNNEIKYVSNVINITLFRIVQEASNNAINHGKATKVVIKLDYNDKFIVLTINDNGIGFIKESLRKLKTNMTSGFGLSIMKERVLLLSGEINIESNDSNGAKIVVRVPL